MFGWIKRKKKTASASQTAHEQYGKATGMYLQSKNDPVNAATKMEGIENVQIHIKEAAKFLPGGVQLSEWTDGDFKGFMKQIEVVDLE